MAPPTNISFETATVIPALPYNIVQDVHDADLNYTVYYKLTAPADCRVIGAWGFSPIAQTFRAQLNLYTVATPPVLIPITATNKPVQFQVDAGSEYYIELVKNGDTSPAAITLDVIEAPRNTISPGNFLISDDRYGDYLNGYPLAVLSHAVDHTVVNFVKNFPAGESADSITNGNMLVDDRPNFDLVLFDTSFNRVATIDFAPYGGYFQIRANRETNKFWVGQQSNPAKIYSVSSTGVLSALVATLTGANGLDSICPNLTDTILYYVPDLGTAIKRWNLQTNTAMSDLCAGMANTYVFDMLLFPDDTIVVCYVTVGVTENRVFVRQINASGGTIREIEIGILANMFARLAYGNDYPNSFWVWYHDALDVAPTPNEFRNYRLSDGVLLSQRSHTAFMKGAYLDVETATPTSRFGTALSCPLLIFPGAAPAPVDTGGIYYIHPTKTARHDSYYRDVEKKIPNPTFRTALIGD